MAGCRSTIARPSAACCTRWIVAIAGFLRGQALVCLLLGLFYAVGLSLLGVNFGALIGIISGFLSFIPYVGSLTGLVLSVGVAIVQFWPDWTWPLATLAVFAAGQFLEGNIFQPKFVGDSIGVHPVWLMFALLAFGTLFGFVGLLLAVPLAAVIGVLCRFALQQYLASNIYHGGERGRRRRRSCQDPRRGRTARSRCSMSDAPRKPRQLAFDLPVDSRHGVEDFLIGPSNEAAYALVEAWPAWPEAWLRLIGPEGAGKTHLAAIWAKTRPCLDRAGAGGDAGQRPASGLAGRARGRGLRPRPARRAGAVPPDERDEGQARRVCC